MTKLAITCLLVSHTLFACSEEMKVRVTEVLATDSLIVEAPDGEHKVSLYGVKADDVLSDLPEAIAFLNDTLLGKDVVFLVHRRFKSGFMLGTVFLDDDIDLSAVLMERGYALWDEVHCRQYSGYGDIVEEARNARAGMWGECWQSERERLAPIVKARWAEELRLRRERASMASQAVKRYPVDQSGDIPGVPPRMEQQDALARKAQAELERKKQQEARAKALEEQQRARLRERDLREQESAQRETQRHTARYDESMPSLTVKNAARPGAVVKLVGPTRATLFVSGHGSETISLRPGTYFVVAKLGLGLDALYCRGDDFTVTANSWSASRITVTLSTMFGNYGTRQITEAEFNRY